MFYLFHVPVGEDAKALKSFVKQKFSLLKSRSQHEVTENETHCEPSASCQLRGMVGAHCEPNVSCQLQGMVGAHCEPTVSCQLQGMVGAHCEPTVTFQLADSFDVRIK